MRTFSQNLYLLVVIICSVVLSVSLPASAAVEPGPARKTNSMVLSPLIGDSAVSKVKHSKTPTVQDSLAPILEDKVSDEATAEQDSQGEEGWTTLEELMQEFVIREHHKQRKGFCVIESKSRAVIVEAEEFELAAHILRFLFSTAGRY